MKLFVFVFSFFFVFSFSFFRFFVFSFYLFPNSNAKLQHAAAFDAAAAMIALIA
jgi:hypothetical protein